MWQKLLHTLQVRLCYLVDFLAKKHNQIRDKTLILIRLDAIGDYVLFRNFIEILANSPTYKGYKITLCGNILWKNLAENLDAKFVENFIWIDKKRFFSDLIYRYQTQKYINQQGFEIAINPTFSPEILDGHALMNVCQAKQKIGSVGDLQNINSKDKALSRTYYTQFVPANSKVLFEFDRNKEFFENLLNIKINLIKPHLHLPEKIDFSAWKFQKYALIIPSAGNVERQWSTANFAKIADYLQEKHNFQILVLGSAADKNMAKNIQENAKTTVLDLTGKTSLLEMAYLIANSNLLVANESSAIHFAAASQSKAVCVTNNTWHTGRFNPYPKAMKTQILYVFPDEIDAKEENFEQIREQYPFEKRLDIDTIAVEKVQKAIEKLLTE